MGTKALHNGNCTGAAAAIDSTRTHRTSRFVLLLPTEMEGPIWTIKATYCEDLRRWSCHVSQLSFDQLTAAIFQHFEKKLDSNAVMSIKYIDGDDDLVTIACQDDLEEALSCLQDTCRLRLHLTSSSKLAPLDGTPEVSMCQGVTQRDTIPQARFVRHVTVPDDSECAPGQPFVKTWRLRNTGPCCWPAGSRLIHVGGALLTGDKETPVPALEPNEECDISVSLVAPTEPGQHVSYWRLASSMPRERRFGQRIWLQMNVPASGGLIFSACECEHPGVHCDMCGVGSIRGIRWRGRAGQEDLCEACYRLLPAQSQHLYDPVIGEHPRTMAAMLKSPLRSCVKRLAARLEGDGVKMGEVLHIVEPLFVAIPRPLLEASLRVVRPFFDAMVTVDDRTLSTLQEQLQGTVHTLCKNKGKLSKTHGKPGTLLHKAVTTVAKIVEKSVTCHQHPAQTEARMDSLVHVAEPNQSGESIELDNQLNQAARSTDDTELIRSLVEQGANLLSTNGSPWFHTPLHQAAYHNRLDVVCCLIELLQERGLLERNLQTPSNPCGRGQHGVPIELAMGGGSGFEAVVAALDSAALSVSECQSVERQALECREMLLPQLCGPDPDSSYNSSCNAIADSAHGDSLSDEELLVSAPMSVSTEECTPSNVLRNNAWLLQEMGFAEDDALAALVGAEGVVEDAIDLASGFEEARKDS